LNIDLIYGGAGQTRQSWEANIREALQYAPDELYIYPLYIRPLTALAQRVNVQDDIRVDAYRIARDMLTAHGYIQISQRMFRSAHAPTCEGPAYCCQLDGMIGLGPCARSYTRTLHYSSEYAVEHAHVKTLIGEYARRDARAFATVDYGFILDEEEQRRRYLLKSILLCEGMGLPSFRQDCGIEAQEAFPQLLELAELGLADIDADRVRLTPRGIEYSDTIGPWLYSPQVVRLMEEYLWH